MVRRDIAEASGFVFRGNGQVGYKDTPEGLLKLVLGNPPTLSIVPFPRPGAPSTLVAEFHDGDKPSVNDSAAATPFHGLTEQLTVESSMSAPERAAMVEWVNKAVPKEKSYDLAMVGLNTLLKQKKITKLSTILLNEMMDEIDRGKFQVNPDSLVKLLALLPKNQRDRMLTDDIVLKSIPSKDWSEFRPNDWVRTHSSASVLKHVVTDGNTIKANMKLELGDLSVPFEDYLKDYDGEADISDFMSDAVKPEIESAVDKLSRKIYNETHSEAMEIHVILSDVHWLTSTNIKDVRLTLEFEIQCQIQSHHILGKIDQYLPAFVGEIRSE